MKCLPSSPLELSLRNRIRTDRSWPSKRSPPLQRPWSPPFTTSHMPNYTQNSKIWARNCKFNETGGSKTKMSQNSDLGGCSSCWRPKLLALEVRFRGGKSSLWKLREERLICENQESKSALQRGHFRLKLLHFRMQRTQYAWLQDESTAALRASTATKHIGQFCPRIAGNITLRSRFSRLLVLVGSLNDESITPLWKRREKERDTAAILTTILQGDRSW